MSVKRTDVYYTSEDGLRLYAAVYGEDHPGRLPVVCLAGLTRNSRDFHEIAMHLAGDGDAPRQVIAFDYRGRGNSEHDPNWKNYDILVEARDVLAGLTACGIEKAAFIGTSRGGLIIMVLAALRPAILKAAILNDIGPVVSTEGLMLIRTYLERAPRPKTFEEAVAIQKAAVGGSFGALDESDWERMVRAFYRQEKRGLVPEFDQNLLKTMKGLDLEKPLPDLWPQFMALANIPVLAIRGGNSRLVAAETLDEMARRHADLQAATVEGQGHAPLLETGNLPTIISTFLARIDRRSSTLA
ncbi:MAG TPA: alpha/beta hydrolase [Rhizobiaceae bacterium]|nr:alpha/beta hydrolase [Rhizobiaceae bacterium]